MYNLEKNNFLKFIPHRKPFIFISKVLYLKKNKCLFSMLKISLKDYFFSGHFPKNPIFPGVFILESMMQSASVLINANDFKIKRKINYVTYIQSAKFYALVYPNSNMYIKISLLHKIKKFVKFKGYALVNNVLVCEAIITIYIK
jgi:3-hydroxyacyl-[acyl-carrier-protein] dehydratase